jgi:hypothetical protein
MSGDAGLNCPKSIPTRICMDDLQINVDLGTVKEFDAVRGGACKKKQEDNF